MFPRCNNQRGFGLIAAIFVVVIVAMFGLLIARFTSKSSLTSVEDYLWGQALYSAESAAQLRILYYDGGGNWAGFSYPDIADFVITPVLDNYSAGNPSTLDVRATRINIAREIEIKYML